MAPTSRDKAAENWTFDNNEVKLHRRFERKTLRNVSRGGCMEKKEK